MAEILSFRTKATAAADSGSEQDFLHQEDHTLSFQVTETGRMGITNILERRKDASQDALNDWSNQELADLYRVKRLLDAAGVPNELDRGLTDEGDPWLVFCGPDGEVFIQLCRLNGLYVLDSPNIQTPLRGADFNALIEAFTNRALPRTGTAAEGGDARVIRLERGGKVYLHPSALMAALIWTLFLAAEEIVLMAPDAEQMTEGLDDIGKLTFGDIRVETQEQEMPVIVAENEKLIEDHMAQEAGNDPRHIAAHEAFLRDSGVQGNSGLTMMQNSYGLGLSTIAIAFGFMADQTFSDDNALLTDESLTAQGDDSLNAEEDARVNADDKTLKSAGMVATEGHELAGDAAADMPTQEAGEADVETAMAATQAVAEGEGQVLTEGLQLIQTRIAEAAQWIDTTFKGTSPQEVITAAASVSTQESSPKASTSDVVVDIGATKAPSPLPTFFTLSTLKTALLPLNMESYSFGETTVRASFDLGDESIGTFSFLDDTPSFEAPVSNGLADPAPGHGSTPLSFDDGARAFMNFILAKLEDIEMVTLDNEMILIDSAVFNEGDSYALSWALDGGGVVSIIGQRAEFAEFDLIA